MANMGLSRWVIVAPRCDPRGEQARDYAARASALLEQAAVVPDIESALRGCVLSLATSAKGGFYRAPMTVSAAQGAELAVRHAVAGDVAIVFGPEDRGLVLNELLHFDRLIEIPADPAYPTLNLAAAVMVVCYEVRLAALRAAPPTAGPIDIARDEHKQVFFRLLFDALDRIDFFRRQQYDQHLQQALRHMFGRLELSTNELDILIGMARQIAWYAHTHPPRTPPDSSEPAPSVR
jgi:TrmH family RNA methyltransferase